MAAIRTQCVLELSGAGRGRGAGLQRALELLPTQGRAGPHSAGRLQTGRNWAGSSHMLWDSRVRNTSAGCERLVRGGWRLRAFLCGPFSFPLRSWARELRVASRCTGGWKTAVRCVVGLTTISSKKGGDQPRTPVLLFRGGLEVQSPGCKPHWSSCSCRKARDWTSLPHCLGLSRPTHVACTSSRSHAEEKSEIS